MAEDRPDLPLARIVDGIRALVEQHASRAEISRRLGKSENWLSRVLLGELKLDLNRAEKILNEIDAPLGWFLSWCFETKPSPPPSRVVELLAGGPPESRDRVSELLGLADEISAAISRDSAEDFGSMPDELVELDELRFTDRAGARDRVLLYVSGLKASGATRNSAACLCWALSIWASIQRTSQQPRDAAAALTWALRATEAMELPTTSAHLRQRSSYLLRDVGSPAQAKRMLESALLDFVQLGRLNDVGRCLVDRGSLELQLERSVHAERDAEAALRLLEDREWRNVGTAHHILAESFIAQERAPEALDSLSRAIEIFRKRTDDVLFGHALWSRAHLQADMGNDVSATSDFRQALELLAGNGMPTDVAVVALQLARSLLVLGKSEEIRQLAEQVQAMSPLFHGAPVVNHVLMEFVLIARYDRLSKAFLAQSLQKIRDGGSGDPP